MTAQNLKDWDDMVAEVHDLNVAKGWHDAEADRTFGESVALLHSEVSEVVENYRDRRLSKYDTAMGKPDDVGAEMADVLIRILDFADREGWSLSAIMAGSSPVSWEPGVGYQVQEAAVPFPADLDPRSFGDHATWLHRRVSDLHRARPYQLAKVVACLLAFASRYNIDLAAEYERKMAYNWTRPVLHGGRTLRGPK